MKRLVKEIVRRLSPRVKPHHDMVIVVRNAALDLDCESMTRSIEHVMKRADLLTS